ncbi:acetyltransferase, GNAT family [Acinetobacter calcoaceticus RUH2202]|uniref:GNAT family N-acetyltransferase n=1 Tax=Acinetobacter calcoaceticus TaxID=471 RepID=UPI0001BB5993|nr:GNAT family N-acetyltransferase [Acinetobacter calcoaceticus]EEY75946.1 acetyltransferase, GNAT family [Acinetobacter calcoaceticus RUH2202]
MTVMLVKPHLRFKESYCSYINELADEERYPLTMDFDHTNFDSFLNKLKEHENGESLQEGHVANITYWLVEGSEIIGVSNLRPKLNEQIQYCGGHIGLGIRPSKRRNDFGSKLLELTIQEAWKLGLTELHIHCYKSNLASAKLIQANNGRLHSEIDVDQVVQRYVVNKTI